MTARPPYSVVGRFFVARGNMASGQDHSYPFTAVVGQEGLKLALLLLAIDPGIGGVLVSGHKGTAKSTAVRALAALLPDQDVVVGCRFGCDPSPGAIWCDECEVRASDGPLPVSHRRPPLVELPVSATEDRLLGTLDFEHALTTGKRRFEPGLMAAANRGLLYADEVNLLDDHLVDAMLDAAASGINTVEREGVACSHPARFALVGTMNPEEGEVRPQLLDRFGLSVRIIGLGDTAQRVEVVRRRRAFDADPVAFEDRFAQDQRSLACRLAQARGSLASVTVSDETLVLIASICAELGVDGHRGDIVIARAAAAHAALDGRAAATAADVRAVAPLALAHRVRRGPVPEQDATEALARVVAAAALAPDGGDRPSGGPHDSSGTGEVAASAAEATDEPRVERSSAGLIVPDASREVIERDTAGRRRSVTSSGGGGRYVRSSVRKPERLGDTALDATLRAAAASAADTPATRAEESGPATPAVSVTAADLRSKVRSRRTGATIVVCVDASGSMGASARMDAARSAVLDLLTDAYVRRDRIGLVAFRADHAEVVLAPTTSIELARMRMAEVRTGGATPLAHGLATSLDLLVKEKRRRSDAAQWLVLVTDGRANVGMGGSPADDAVRLASEARDAGVRLLVVEVGPGPETPGLPRDLADAGGGSYVRLAAADGVRLATSVRARLVE
jgi:magnesium chelatase subunit D